MSKPVILVRPDGSKYFVFDESISANQFVDVLVEFMGANGSNSFIPWLNYIKIRMELMEREMQETKVIH